MLTVIFGAGASFDSVHGRNLGRHELDYRPPLASELFAHRPNFGAVINEYGELRPIMGDLRQAISDGGNVELELEKLKSQADKYPKNHIYLAAIQMYLQRVLWECGEHWSSYAYGVTNYASLLNQIDRWRLNSADRSPVALVTFNYDTMLEEACAGFGLALSTLDDYVSGSEYRVFKPHGSVNWGRVTADTVASSESSTVRHELIARAPINLTDEFRILTDLTVPIIEKTHSTTGTTSRALSPAIAIPVQSKDESVFTFPGSHRERMEEALAATRILLVIGWRGAEEHFMSLLRKAAPQVQKLIAVSDKQETAEATVDMLLSTAIRSGPGRIPLGKGFSGLIDRRDEFRAMLD